MGGCFDYFRGEDKYGVEMLDSVMMALLRKGKEALLTEGVCSA